MAKEQPKQLIDDLSDRERDQIINRLKQDYNWAESERSDRESDWDEFRDQYESEWVELTEDEDDEDLDQWFYVPKTFNTVHRIECAARQHFFPTGEKRLGRVSPALTTGENPTAAKILDMVVHAKVDIELNPVRQFQDAFNAALVEHAGVLKCGWRRDVHVGEDGQPRPTSQATLSWVPNEHVCWDPHALTPDEIRFFIHEMWLDEDELWARQDAGIYRDVEKVVTEGNKDETSRDTWREAVGGPGNKQRYLYKVIEFWGPLQLLERDKLDEMHRGGRHQRSMDVVATVHLRGGAETVLRLERNTYADLFDNPTPYEKLPFVLMTALPKRGDTYGRSLVQLMKGIQLEANLLRNQRRQAVEMEMARKTYYDRNRGINLKEASDARYCGFVGVDGDPHGAIYDVAPSTSTGGLQNEEMVVDADLRELSGVTNFHHGGSMANMDTATGISIVTQEGNVKLDNILQNLADSGVVPVVRFFAECAKRWMDPSEIQRIIGSNTPPPPLEQILGHDYHIEVEAGASATSKAVRLQNINAAVAALGQVANVMPESALPAMDSLMPEMLRLLGMPQAVAAYLKDREQGMGSEYGAAPAGSQGGAMPNAANQMAMARQGRGPTDAERPQFPGRV